MTSKTLPPEIRARLALLAARGWAQELSSPEIALAFVNGELERALELPEDTDIEGLVAAVLAVGRERKELLDRLRTALMRSDQQEVLNLARELCNLAQTGEDSHDDDPRGPQTVH